MKKFKAVLTLALAALTALAAAPAYAADGSVEVGEYIQLGTYQSESIVWRCIDEDENGKLILSDKILCYKSFDATGNTLNGSDQACGFWEYSTLRTWLNSDKFAGEIEWVGENEPSDENVAGKGYSDEDGFLSTTNFSESEISVMKTLGQWQIANISNIEKSENGIYFGFGLNYYPYRAEWIGFCTYNDVTELSHVEGGMYRINDTIFLLNEPQVYNLYNKFGTIFAENTSYAETELDNYNPLNRGHNGWWLRTAMNRDVTRYVYSTVSYGYAPARSSVAIGVRPAFYLNESSAVIISGSGTVDDPYIVDGTESDGITVFSNGEQLDFNVDPVIENDSTLVGMRTIFESLGADVDWDSDTWTATASLDDTTVSLQIDNDVMLVNDEEVALDTPARIINDNTMVPLRAISESLGATVEWVENLNRIVIDKPEPQVFDDNKGMENWQTGEFGDWQPDSSKHRGGWYEYLESLQEDSE